MCQPPPGSRPRRRYAEATDRSTAPARPSKPKHRCRWCRRATRPRSCIGADLPAYIDRTTVAPETCLARASSAGGRLVGQGGAKPRRPAPVLVAAVADNSRARDVRGASVGQPVEKDGAFGALGGGGLASKPPSCNLNREGIRATGSPSSTHVRLPPASLWVTVSAWP